MRNAELEMRNDVNEGIVMAAGTNEEMQRFFQKRICFTQINPHVDEGRYPAKRLLGDELIVQATIFRDGTDFLRAAVGYRHESEMEFKQTALQPLGNDAWQGSFPLEKLGKY